MVSLVKIKINSWKAEANITQKSTLHLLKAYSPETPQIQTSKIWLKYPVMTELDNESTKQKLSDVIRSIQKQKQQKSRHAQIKKCTFWLQEVVRQEVCKTISEVLSMLSFH